MINLIHMLAIIIGGLSYLFSDVNSSSGFTNTLLPVIALLAFIYGIIVTVNMLYNIRKKSDSVDKSSGLLFESMKEFGEKKFVQEDINENIEQ